MNKMHFFSSKFGLVTAIKVTVKTLFKYVFLFRLIKATSIYNLKILNFSNLDSQQQASHKISEVLKII